MALDLTLPYEHRIQIALLPRTSCQWGCHLHSGCWSLAPPCLSWLLVATFTVVTCVWILLWRIFWSVSEHGRKSDGNHQQKKSSGEKRKLKLFSSPEMFDGSKRCNISSCQICIVFVVWWYHYKTVHLRFWMSLLNLWVCFERAADDCATCS